MTREQREEIIETYLVDPAKANSMAAELGLAENYARKAARERGLLPLTPRPYKRRGEA